jgi:hypothetical protein
MHPEPYTSEFVAGADEQRHRIQEFLNMLSKDFRDLEGEDSKDAAFIDSISQVIETDEELRVS